MKITDEWIKKQVKRFKRSMVKSPKPPVLNMKDLVDNVKLIESYEDTGSFWVMDNYLYATGIYKEKLQNYIHAQEKNTTKDKDSSQQP